MNRGILFCLLSLCFTSTIAQTSVKKYNPGAPANTLLWRISGNGLHESSYLFGTMHLNDKRLFNFDDSVYHSIEQCAGLAIELNPDEMMAYQITRMFDDLMKGQKLKEVLSDKDYGRYSKKLSRKFRKSAGDITTSDIVQEKNKWMTEYFEKGEMPTFVDAYLYNLAKKQGKWVGGIEDIADQAGIIEDNVDKTDIEYILAENESDTEGKNMLEQMIRLYSTQDLEGIYSMISGNSSAEEKDLILTRRNAKMVRRMDSLSAIRTMFFAVGAAHLPGDSGVISLLIKKGFQVEPVFSSTKIRSADYKAREVDIPWIHVKDENNLYEVNMPGTPTPVKLQGVVEMKFLIDIFNFSGYYTTAISSAAVAANKDSTLLKFAQNVFGTQRKIPSTSIIKNGIEGKEYIETKDNMVIRLQLFSDENILYAAAMFALKKDILRSASATKYFSSLVLNKKSSPAVSEHHSFNDQVMGLNMLSPAKLTLNEQMNNLSNEAWKITVFTGSDLRTGVYIMLFSREVKPGYSIASDSSVYAEQFAKLKESYSNVVRTDSNSASGKIVEFSGNQTANPAVVTKVISTIKNNRNILLMVFGDSASFRLPSVQRIFTSLEFTQPPAAKWNWRTDTKNGFSAWMPGNLRNVPGNFQNNNQVFGFDTTTSTSFFIDTDTLSKYSWYNSDSSLWKAVMGENANQLQISSSKDVQNGKIKGKEIQIKLKTNYDIHTRTRILFSDSIMYLVSVSASKALINSYNVNKLFDSLKITREGNPGFLNISKSKLILHDLQDENIDIRTAAYHSLEKAPFTKEDLPWLHEALFKNYRSLYDSSDYSTDINLELSYAVAKLNDSSTIPYIKEKYAALGNDSTKLRTIALATLAKIKTAKSYNTLAGLMNSYSLQEQTPYYLTATLEDSLELTASIFPELLNLAGDSLAGISIARLAHTLLDSALIGKETVRAKANDFVHLGEKLLPYLSIKDSSNYYHHLFSFIQLLGTLDTEQSLQMLDRYQQLDNKYFRMEVVRQLLKKNRPVNASVINNYAADKEMRSQLYDDLLAAKQLSLFPKKFLTRQQLAESIVYAINEDETPDAIEFVSIKEAVYKKTTYSFYLFKITYGKDDDAISNLGIAGGYTKDKNAVKPAENLSGIYTEDSFRAAGVQEQLNDYLKNLEMPLEN